jgi:hypothetical protein
MKCEGKSEKKNRVNKTKITVKSKENRTQIKEIC